MTKERSLAPQIGPHDSSTHAPLHLSYTTSATTSSDLPTTYASDTQNNDVLSDEYARPRAHVQIVEKDDIDPEFVCVMPINELGVLMSILYRIQNILVLNSSHFDELTLHLLQVLSCYCCFCTFFYPSCFLPINICIYLFISIPCVLRLFFRVLTELGGFTRRLCCKININPKTWISGKNNSILFFPSATKKIIPIVDMTIK